jgi:hypothetical protein
MQVGLTGFSAGHGVAEAYYAGSNAYYDGSNWRYTANGYAAYCLTSAGNFAWQIAPSGTAGNAISFTQAMTLDANGYLGIGTTNPSASAARLVVSKSSGVIASFTNDVDADFQIQTGTATTTIGSTTSTPLIFKTGNTERLRLDSSGNLGIGTTTVNERLEIYKGISYNADPALYFRIGANDGAVNNNAPYTWRTGITGSATGYSYVFQTLARTESSWVDRARITAGGDLLVGTTSASDNANVGIKNIYSATAPYVATVGSASTNGTVAHTLYSTGAAAFRFYVGYGGTVYATNTTISAISDQRYKENIRDLDAGLDAVMALKPRKFDWKEGKGKDIKNDRGFIAQEFEQVFPDLVDEWKDPAPEGEEPYKSVRQDLIPVLVKAIQEQQAMINELKAEIAALKGA